MIFLLQSATIFDSNSPFHLQRKDIYIENGIITGIEAPSENTTASDQLTIIKSKNLCVSNGWVDMNVVNTDPGYEHRDTLKSLIKNAIYGGYTHIGLMPNTQPIVQNKGAIENILIADQKSAVSLIPYGALSINAEGKEMAELYDMFHGGAIAFTDGNGSHVSKPLLKRALLYCKAFNGLILHHAEEDSLTEDGTIHEGKVSAALGMVGRPSLAEVMGIMNALYLVEYTNGKIHFLNISTKEGVEKIRNAKKELKNITASVNAYNLYFEDTSLMEFDTNFKVNPPIRSEEDRNALIEGILDGTIDVISSSHSPLDEESKKLEFDLANYGMITFPFNFQMILGAMNKNKIEKWIHSITTKPREILGIPLEKIDIGKTACLTLFDNELKTTLTYQNNPGKSINSPLFNQELVGKVLGIYHKNNLSLNI